MPNVLFLFVFLSFFLLGLLCRELKVGIYLWIWKYLLFYLSFGKCLIHIWWGVEMELHSCLWY